MKFELAIRIGDIIQFIGIVIGGFIVLVTMKLRLDQLEESMKGINEEVRKITAVLVELGRQDERLKAMSHAIEDIQAWRESRVRSKTVA